MPYLCPGLLVPLLGKLVPCCGIRRSWWCLIRYSDLLDGSVFVPDVVESLFRCLVLVFEVGDRSVLSKHLGSVMHQVESGIADGSRNFLLHEIQIQEVLDPTALSQQRRNLHHSFAMLQEVRVEIGVEELTGSQGCRARCLLVDEKFRHQFQRGFVDGLHDVGVGILVGCDIVDERQGSGIDSLLLFGRKILEILCAITPYMII